MIERFGWTLVHFLWQGVLIAVVYASARRRLKGGGRPEGLPHAANARYLLACAALAAMVAAPLVTFGLLATPELSQTAAPLAIGAAPISGAGTPNLGPVSWIAASQGRESLLTSVVLLWLAGASAFCVRLMGGWWIARRMRSQRVRRAPPEWQAALDRIAARIGIARPVRLLVSALVQVPTVVGWLRPVVLVPVAALTGLPPEHVEALLAHELAHIRRHDYLVNILQSIAEALLFYHPVVWWVSGHIRGERELCCDDIAVSVSGDVLTYARALAELESNRTARFNPALAANGGSLADRIGRLLGQSRPAARTLPGPGVIASAVLLIIAAYGLFGQSAARPKFEVASIKPNNGQAFFFGVNALPGGRLSASGPVRVLIMSAYDVKPFQISGGPDWINSDSYNIEAKAEGNASPAQMRLMTQSLLEDRFQMKVHRETKQLPVYVLTMMKNGAKLPQPKEGGCTVFDPNAPPKPPEQGQPPVIPCGGSFFTISPSGTQLFGGKVPMAELTRSLSNILGRTVIDKTGFSGTFDLHLQFASDATLEGLPRVGVLGGPPGASDSTDPTIFTALTEQLGLKLESVKGPVEVLVIDHVERPTEN